MKSWVVIALLLCAPAAAQTVNGPSLSSAGLTPTVLANQGFFIAPNTVGIGAAGSGYAAGDMVTLSCPSATFSVAPNIAITTVSGNVPTSILLSMPRAVSSTAGIGTVTCTQASTTGAGVGLTVTLQFTPTNPDVSVMALTTGGAVNNGNLFINLDTVTTTYAGAEGTFVGDKAGGAFSGIASANSAFGHNACGINFASAPGPGIAPTGSNNSCFGNDAGRNINGAATSNLIGGQAAAEDLSGNNNVILGEAAAIRMTTGIANIIIGQGAVGTSVLTATGDVIIGQGAGTHMVSGNQNVVIGNAVASTTLATGAGNLIIGTSSSCDAAAAGTNNSIRICMGGGLAWSLANGSTPSTSTTTIAGNLVSPGANITFSGVTTGTNADFVCMAAGGTLTLQTSACTISSLRFKDVLGDLTTNQMVADIMALHPLAFKMKTPDEPNADPNYDRPQIGLTAENVAAVDPRLAIYEDDMTTPKSYRQEGVIAALVVTAQAQQREIYALCSAMLVLAFWCMGMTVAVVRLRKRA